jgi:hypothetical protein
MSAERLRLAARVYAGRCAGLTIEQAGRAVSVNRSAADRLLQRLATDLGIEPPRDPALQRRFARRSQLRKANLGLKVCDRCPESDCDDCPIPAHEAKRIRAALEAHRRQGFLS